ncbi:MAG: phosphoglucosamine mutase [Solirubrobacteraceae bacterium]|jgi:phosphoglucosamine mutase|nr:phosphoglucosamine mutase [Solirubrobacteraceae bacterium]
MARRLFGTDGVRGPAGTKITAELAVALASAAVRHAAGSKVHERPQVVVIRDTRESGTMLEAAIAAGVAAAGGDALLGGVLPTPAAPLLIRRYGFDLGVVLSASHNPFQDNGIKFFGADGDKLSDAEEEEIEALLEQPPAPDADVGRVRALHGTLEDYLRELHTRFQGLDLNGLDVLLDCANGAAYRAAPEIFRRLGATVTATGVDPDGRNINDGCGSTHVEKLAAQVREGGHDLGFAFDGDADRVLAADRHGAVVDGDELIALAALHLQRHDRLPGHGVAVTVMTNYGFHTAMREADIEVATTQVGDRYVIEALRERGFALGGEQSGHIIDLGFTSTGDGIASALLVLEALGGGDLAERHGMDKLPQRLVNVRVADRDAALQDSGVTEAVTRESEALEGRGRVLVRPSGTEPVVRVMVEAPTEDEAAAVCDRLVVLMQGVTA